MGKKTAVAVYGTELARYGVSNRRPRNADKAFGKIRSPPRTQLGGVKSE